MSPNSLCPGAVCPAAAVHEDIRAFWRDPRVGLTPDQRAAYVRLLTEWTAAVRADVVTHRSLTPDTLPQLGRNVVTLR